MTTEEAKMLIPEESVLRWMEKEGIVKKDGGRYCSANGKLVSRDFALAEGYARIFGTIVLMKWWKSLTRNEITQTDFYETYDIIALGRKYEVKVRKGKYTRDFHRHCKEPRDRNGNPMLEEVKKNHIQISKKKCDPNATIIYITADCFAEFIDPETYTVTGTTMVGLTEYGDKTKTEQDETYYSIHNAIMEIRLTEKDILAFYRSNFN